MIRSARASVLLLFLVAPMAAGQATQPVKLFNGTDLSGWSAVSKDPATKLADVWSVADGVIRCTGKPNGYLKTDRAYSNYLLIVEWRWPEKPGNSGVFIHTQEPDTIWPKCFEAQLANGNAGDVNLNGGMTAGTEGVGPRKNRVPKKEASSEKPAGEWNRYEIRAAGDTIEIKVNGVQQNLVSGATFTSGAIALQAEGAPIEFRNVELTPLADDAKTPAATKP